MTLASSLVACRPSPHAPGAETTHVGRSQLYRSGQITYDRYFAAVHQLQEEVARAPAERRVARAELAHALGLLPESATGRVVTEMHERAVDLSKSGHWFRVEGYRAVTEGAAPGAPVRSVGQALDACLRSEEQAAERLRQVPIRARALWDLTRSIEGGLDADFFGFKRKEVKAEVAAVKRSLRMLSDESTARLLEGEKFVLDLTAAVSPGALAFSGGAPSPSPSAAAEPDHVEKKKAHSARKPAAERPPLAVRPATERTEPKPAALPAAERPAPKPAAERPAPKPPAPKPAAPKPAKPAGDDFNP
ncbi:MAG: hypothetical protein MUF34_05775 [Polyangiaceae bacterium]|nr:hypothetical protein [Polyangiaceae bacterium]